MEITLIAAMSKDRVIGIGLDIPWICPNDLTLFRGITQSQWCIVGRRTYETVKHLKNRQFIVVSTQENLKVLSSNAARVDSYEDALQYARDLDLDNILVIGGGTIYKQAIQQADTLVLSIINREFDDHTDEFVYFPEIPERFTRRLRVNYLDVVCPFEFTIWS